MSGPRRDERASQQRPERGGDDHRTCEHLQSQEATRRQSDCELERAHEGERCKEAPRLACGASLRSRALRALAYRRLNVASPLGVRAGHALVKVEEGGRDGCAGEEPRTARLRRPTQ